jgi:Dolichyl-phosphate-mannose-protein mannosyltransferase
MALRFVIAFICGSFQGAGKMKVFGGLERFERILALAVFLEFLALAALHLCAIPVHISRSYNEGWNAYFAQAAMDGGVLYPPMDSMLMNNYPPLSFYIVGVIGRVVGDNIVAGRLVAVLSLGVVATSVFGLSRWLGADRKLAVLTSGVFLLGTYTVMPGYIAIDDPQFLAYAFVTSGAFFFLQAKDESLWRYTLLSTLLMTIGGLIKHSEISLPVALCSWSIIYDRRRFGVFAICAFFFVSAAVVITYSAFGAVMFQSILSGARMIVIGKAFARMAQDFPFLLPYVVLAVAAAVLMKRSPRASFVMIYLACSLFNGFWMLTGYGVSQNVMCDAVIALSLASALFVMAAGKAFVTASVLGGHGRMLAVLLMTLPCMASSFFVYRSNPASRDIGEIVDSPKWESLYSILSRAPGPVACETLAICYWAKKPMEVDFFNYGQKVSTASVYVDAPNGFLAKVSQKAFAYVVIESASLPGSRLPPILISVLYKNYKPVAWVEKTELVLAPREMSSTLSRLLRNTHRQVSR